MAAKLFFLPYQVATVGNIAQPGAKLYFYQTATTTRLNTYTTSALTTAHPHPVVANGAGRFPDVYLDSTKTYRLIIKTKTGTTLEDIDPYIPGTAPDASSLQPYQDACEDAAAEAAVSAAAAEAAADAAEAAASGTAVAEIETARAAIEAALAASGSVDLDTLSASGLPLSVKWFGATGDGVTDDSAAFVAALAAADTLASTISIYAKFKPEIFVPIGHYYMGTTTLDLTTTTTIRGVGGRGNQASRLRWAHGATGIRVQAYNTSGATGTKTGTHEASWTLLEGLKIEGGYAGTEAEYHGVHLRSQATIRDCMIANWSGDGIRATASIGAGTSSPYEGNVNVFAVENVWCHSNRNGLYLDGADANAGHTIGLNCTSNRQAGIFDSSFLGNTHIAPHLEENGVTDGVAPCQVEYGGKIYCCIVGQETGASTNAPSGTTADNTWWAYKAAGVVNTSRNIRAWNSGTAYRSGGPFISDNDANRRGLVLGMYTEGDQPLCQAYAPCEFTGGTWGSGFTATSTAIRRTGGSVVGEMSFSSNVYAPRVLVGPANIAGAAADDAFLYLDNNNSDSNIYFRRNGVQQGRIFSNNFYNRLLIQGVNGLYLGGTGYNGEQVSIDVNGLDLRTGDFKIDGTKVVGARQSAIANHASDTTVNAILAALRAHGLIAS
jgi:hypothetical protein